VLGVSVVQSLGPTLSPQRARTHEHRVAIAGAKFEDLGETISL
jgi:hypothetical protein